MVMLISPYIQGFITLRQNRHILCSENSKILQILCSLPNSNPIHSPYWSQKRFENDPNEIELENNMKTNTRFIKSICETAAKEDVAMPLARGARRAAFIAKRKDNEIPVQKAA